MRQRIKRKCITFPPDAFSMLFLPSSHTRPLRGNSKSLALSTGVNIGAGKHAIMAKLYRNKGPADTTKETIKRNVVGPENQVEPDYKVGPENQVRPKNKVGHLLIYT